MTAVPRKVLNPQQPGQFHTVMLQDTEIVQGMDLNDTIRALVRRIEVVNERLDALEVALDMAVQKVPEEDREAILKIVRASKP